MAMNASVLRSCAAFGGTDSEERARGLCSPSVVRTKPRQAQTALSVATTRLVAKFQATEVVTRKGPDQTRFLRPQTCKGTPQGPLAPTRTASHRLRSSSTWKRHAY